MTQKLKIITKGNGKPLVVLHGWGMNSKVWQPVKKALEKEFSVYWIDLPGHGFNRELPLLGIDHVSKLIAESIPNDAVLLGWSLGGLIAQNIALKFKDKVSCLIIVASSPSFVQHDDWKHAMQAEILKGFAENLQVDFNGTLKRFLALQFLGIKGIQKQVKALREELLSLPPATQALADGLEILKTANFNQLQQTVKTHWILGELDRLVPASVEAELGKQKNVSVDVIKKAGHAPFISHPEEFIESVLKGVNNV